MKNDPDELLREYGIITRPPGFDYSSLPDRKPLTKKEAVALINLWRERNVPKRPGFHVRSCETDGEREEIAYQNELADHLILRILTTSKDPIAAVAKYIYEMDDIRSRSSSMITKRFTWYMENVSIRILSFLKEKEKELND